MRSFTLACAVLAATAAPSDAIADDPDPPPCTSTVQGPPQTTFVTLEHVELIERGKSAPGFNGSVIRMLKGPFGAYSFFYVDKGYAEALVGPAFAPTDWLAIAAGVGMEQWDSGSWRVGGMLWMGKPKWATLTLVETGASGFWARTEFAYRLRPWIGIGALGDTLLGTGPRLEVNLPATDRTTLSIWYAPLYDWSEATDSITQAVGFRIAM